MVSKYNKHRSKNNDFGMHFSDLNDGYANVMIGVGQRKQKSPNIIVKKTTAGLEGSELRAARKESMNAINVTIHKQ